MKAINKMFMGLGLLAAAAGFSSCVGDLDVPVVNPNQLTSDQFQQDPKAYLNRCFVEMFQGLATAGNGGPGNSILGFGDAGAGSFTRTVFNLEEMTTDNFSWLQFNDAGYYELVTMNYAPDNEIMYANYSRLYVVVSLANEFINTVNQGKFGSDPEVVQMAADYVRQAKIVRSLCYYYAISAYGNAGYADENLPAGSAPAQLTRAELFNQVVKDLETVSNEYGDSYAAPAYGFVGKEAADALLTKFYLNAETWTGTPMYGQCWALCQKIIANHTDGLNGTGLAEQYISLFGANNNEYTYGGSRAKEILWTIPQDGMNLQSYGGSTFYICTTCGSYDGISSIDDCNLNAQWTCMVARQQLSEAFSYTADGTPTDERAKLWKTKRDGFVIDNNTIMGNAGYGQGYAPLKYTNFYYNADGTIDEIASAAVTNNAFADADWPVIRLAEIYLNAAEAYVLGHAGNADDAVNYVKYVRERAGLEPWTASDLTANNILAERQRELYGENDRRTSLVRHHKYAGSAYNWNWKGGVWTGVATDEKYNLFPIPTKVVSFSGYKQNPGY